MIPITVRNRTGRRGDGIAVPQGAELEAVWNDAENRYTVIGFVKNAFNEIGYGSSTGGSPTPVGSRRTVSLNYPRT